MLEAFIEGFAALVRRKFALALDFDARAVLVRVRGRHAGQQVVIVVAGVVGFRLVRESSADGRLKITQKLT